MIQIADLTKQYGEHTVLNHITLSVENGSIFGLLGPNGAGKSTLISTLMGLHNDYFGTAMVDGKEVMYETASIRNISSLIPQNLAFYPMLTVKENLEFFGGMLGKTGKHLQARIEDVVEIAKLENVFYQKAHTCSGGLKRRLNIAIGLLSDPKIIYFDEPTVGIDPQSRNFILESIKKMQNADRVIVYTSHYMEEVEFLCDSIAIMDHGKIIQSGSLDALLKTIKATIRTDKTVFHIAVEEIPDILTKLRQEGETIRSIDYGHALENYFLTLTHKEVRE